ncbi:hypothetical protein [Nocardioides sp.]|uniref:hypothetical protein n=1 Tax=Nocardioides sp. TaxID=35761 RepID=UPI002ED33DE0
MGARLEHVDPRVVVSLAAAAAAVLRFPGALYPLGPDESGYTIVARNWDPSPASVYGDYFVDRPPALIGLFGLSDALAGPGLVRVVGALSCAVLVLLAAATARAALRYAGVGDQRFQARTGAWTAVLTAAFTSSALIDPVMVKGEVLGIPWVVGSFWLVIRTLERPDGRTAYVQACGAGFAASFALGMKQNLVAGLVFGVVLLVGARLTRRIASRDLWRLGSAALIGALLPVLATVSWATAADVRLEELWYTVFGFRSDALAVIAAGSSDAPLDRALQILGIVLATGMGFVVAGVVIHRNRIARIDPALLAATTLVLVVDVGGLLLGGSFWRPYLFALVPGMVLCTTLLLAARDHVARRARLLIVLAGITSVLSSAVWLLLYESGVGTAVEVRSGEAIAEAAQPGDSILVYGGRADLVLASGLPTPYPYLWSLPMRTLDPDLEQLQTLLSGPDAPTWVVMAAPGGSWDGLADVIRPALDERYDVHGEVCNGRYAYLRADAERPPLTPDCDET